MGLASLAAAGWWVVRAPAIRSHVETPAAHDADVDLDPPALRARREAVIAVAKAPDDPWTLAESLGAASAPAAGAAADSGRCGDDERPRVAGTEPGEANEGRVAGPGYLAARARMDAALRNSVDPFDRSVADWLDVGEMRSPVGRVDALVQQAVAATDPRVYALAWRTCLVGRPSSASCGALSARQWAALDAGNGVPWLYVFDRARSEGDDAAQREALAGLAAASRFDDYRFAATAAVAARAPDDDRGLAAVTDLSIEAIGRSFAELAPVAPLMQACRANAGGDAARAQQCQAISDTMYAHSDSLILSAMAGGLQFQLDGDPSKRRAARAERERAAKAWSPGTGFAPCQQERDILAQMRRKGEVGEVEEMRERLRRPVAP